VLKLARGLLDGRGGLAALATATPAQLRLGGIPEAGSVTLLAAYELACRLSKEQLPDSPLLSRPDLVARYLTLRYQQRDQELMGALFLDVRHRLIGEREIFRGTLHRAAVEPREILKECLLRGAAGVALFHYVSRHIMEVMCPRPLCCPRPRDRVSAAEAGGALVRSAHITSEGIEPAQQGLVRLPAWLSRNGR
jgi:hypothetical protein